MLLVFTTRGTCLNSLITKKVLLAIHSRCFFLLRFGAPYPLPVTSCALLYTSHLFPMFTNRISFFLHEARFFLDGFRCLTLYKNKRNWQYARTVGIFMTAC